MLRGRGGQKMSGEYTRPLRGEKSVGEGARAKAVDHRVHIFTRDETGLVCLPTQLEHTLQLNW